jgi:raffinose/stachyose/melibiose transport system substrate-binding protein
MKRRTVLKYALGLAAGALFATGSYGQEKVTVSFLHKWPEPENMAFFQKAVKEFQELHPNIAIKMEAVADEPYKDKIRVVMASGNIPDIFFAWSGEYARQFIRAGRAMDLTAALSSGDWQGRFPESTLDPYKFDGKIYGIPMNLDAKFMIYNKALFQKAGIGSAPADWDEFIADLEKLKAAGITPIAFGNQLPWAASHYIGDLNAKLVPDAVRRSDYDLKSPDDTLFTDPGYVDALTRFQEFATKGYFNKSPNGITHAIARGSFTSGREAMMYAELVEFTRYKNSKLEKDGWGFFPLPAIKDGRGSQTILTGAPDGFMVSSATKNPKETLEFLDFLTTPKNGAEYTKISGQTTAVKGAINADNASSEMIAGTDAFNNATALALWLDTDIDSRTTAVYLAGAQAILNGTETPKQVMEKVRQTALQVKKERS